MGFYLRGAASLAEMAARQAKGDTALARLVRERQELVGEWRARDELLVAAISKPAAERVPLPSRSSAAASRP
jgi:hypothetical protein